MSNPDHWPRVKEIFHSALELARHKREAFLSQACGDDAALRHEVVSLLAAHADAEGFAETPAIAMLADTGASAPAKAAALAPGIEFGSYRILGTLGTGGMGEVYRARDSRLERDVAVKVLPPALSMDVQRIARLEREARVLASLNHPHIATIHSLETVSGICALVMELIEGPTLDDYLGRRALPMTGTLEIAGQIAAALEAAHEKGIVHRDLKPANIKLTVGGTLKILDFGLATAVGPDEHGTGAHGEAGGSPIGDGFIAGTPAYMSPEQARGERVDQRSDIWAFGCVLYEMLTGRRAFGGSTISETLDAMLEHEPDWGQLPPTVPNDIRRLLRRCLERDPKRRLHHIADARIEIEDAARDSTADSPAAAGGFRRSERVFAGLALALAIVVGVLFLRSRRELPEMRVFDIATPWTSDPLSFALSPDGRRLAFVGEYQGQPTIWVRPLDSAEAQPLPGTQGARRPFWSADSRSIGFFAFTELKRIDARGGAPQTVASIMAGTAAAWSASGNILFSGGMSRTISPSPTGLLRINDAGGSADIATRPVAQSTGHRYPQFLPNGREFLYFVAGASDVRGVYVGSLDSSESTRLVASDSQGAYLPPGWLLFVRQGTLLAQQFDTARRRVSGEPFLVADSVTFDPITGGAAISTSDTGVFAYRSSRGLVTQFAWFDRSGRNLGAAGPSHETGLSNLALSPDGRRVVAERTSLNETALWLLDASHQMLFTRPTDDRMARWPVWSPGGDRIAFASVGTASTIVYARPTAGGDEEALLKWSTDAILSDWSRDRRFLLYFAPDPRTGTDLWVLPKDTRDPKVFLATPANEMWGQFSPDGRWIAYQSNESGRFEIYVRPFPGPGAAIPISTGGGVYVRWSRNGDELYYVAPDATMMAVPIRRTRTMLSAGEPVALFKTRRVGGGVNVIRYGHQYDVAPDGRFLINVEPEFGTRPITLVLNWRPSTH